MNKLVAMSRIKDGILFVDDWLKHISPLVDEIVVVDNGSTDGTLEVLRKHPKVVLIEQTEGFHEGRDKRLAYELARKRNADWLLWLDIDMWFEDRVDRKVIEKMINSRKVNKYYFRYFNFCYDYRHITAGIMNLWYISVPACYLWREQPSGYFRNERIHKGEIKGIVGRRKYSRYRVKHVGAINRDYLKLKTETYLSVDPDNAEMYIKSRDAYPPVWPWYEYKEAPLIVHLQMFFLDLLALVGVSVIVVSKVLSSIKTVLRRPSNRNHE